jgi:hypothetical protein
MPMVAIVALTARRKPTGAPWFQSSGSSSRAGPRSIRLSESIDSSIHRLRSLSQAAPRRRTPRSTMATMVAVLVHQRRSSGTVLVTTTGDGSGAAFKRLTRNGLSAAFFMRHLPGENGEVKAYPRTEMAVNPE